MSASAQPALKAQPVKSLIGKMSPLTGDGVAGPVGLHALEDIKQDKGSVTIHLQRMGAAPAQALHLKHSTVRGGSTHNSDLAVGCIQRRPHRLGQLCSPHQLPLRLPE